jgi:phenylacetate-coenzyme A ligase PaaK-like adenylate-forming protein
VRAIAHDRERLFGERRDDELTFLSIGQRLARLRIDDLEIRLEVEGNVFSDSMADMVGFQRLVADKLQSVLGLRARITLVEPGAIERSAGKTQRVLDLRVDS